jgi:2-phospho-L-lactate guanylyltransferase
MPSEPPGWTAIVPFKPRGERKTRLQSSLPPAARETLAETLFRTVIAALAATPAIAEIVLLATAAPPGWQHAWAPDLGQGLNTELSRTRLTRNIRRLIVIHADLPFVTPADIASLAAEDTQASIAPDRHGAGTNALALRDNLRFEFAFGPASFQRHLAAAPPGIRIVNRPGLSFDIDTTADLDLAISRGFLIK